MGKSIAPKTYSATHNSHAHRTSISGSEDHTTLLDNLRCASPISTSGVAFKIWMSAQMQQDLLALATHAGIGFSPFLREAVVGALFRRGSLPARPDIIGMPSAQALAWEKDAEVPTAVIEVADFHDLGHAERLWLDEEKA